MAMRFPIGKGCSLFLLILFVPAILTVYLLHSPRWLVIVPLGIIGLVFLVAAIPGRKLRVTPEQLAEKLERHLLGTGNNVNWDELDSVGFADERLERNSWMFLDPRFHSLKTEKDREDLKAIIAVLRRGELPEVIPPTHLTYPEH